VKIIKTEMIGDWGLKIVILTLLGYFCLLFPLVNIFLREFRWIGGYLYPGYLALTIILISAIYKTKPDQFGFSGKKLFQHVMIGAISGGAILISLPLLDFLIDLSGLGKSELFAGAELRDNNNSVNGMNPATTALSLLLIPIIEQVFFSGFILQTLLKKLKPLPAIYLGAVIFTAAHFSFQLGIFAVGLTTAFFYYKTGSIYAGILFQILCSAGGILIQYVYPRLTTFLVFLN